MSVIFEVIIGGYFCSVICFLNWPNYGALPSLRAYRRRAQDSEVKVVSLLKCQSVSKLLLKVIFLLSFVFEMGQIMGLPSPSELTGVTRKLLLYLREETYNFTIFSIPVFLRNIFFLII